MARLQGVVDGVVSDELCGWLVNMDDEHRLEPVICRGGGRQLTFIPFVFREDVVTAVGKDGVFGFAIPLSLLSDLGPDVTVFDRQGTVLAHGEAVRLPETGDSRGEDATCIFLHIPKTAGTSLRNTLLRGVPAGECLLLYPGSFPGLSLQRALQVPLSHRNRLRWIYGHNGFGFHRYLSRASRYVTFLRDPLERLRSNYNHHAAAGTEFDINGVSVRPSVMINEGLCEEFDNVMTRYLAGVGPDLVAVGRVGEDEVELAVHNVREHFAFVGLQDRAAADVALLQQSLGLTPSPLSMDNVTPPESLYDAAELAAVDWDLVAAHNRADQLLYRRLQQERLVSQPLGEIERPIA